MDDLDYLFSTARIRTMEAKLLTQQRLSELTALDKPEDVTRKLEELGWQAPDFSSYDAMDRSLAAERHRCFSEIASFAPDKSMIRVFQLKYDYHNIKAILKARAQGKSYEGMLSASGSIDPQKMAAMLSEENFQAMSPAMRKATEEAEEVLARTQDPLYADMALDRACYAEMLQMAKNSESEFLQTYIKMQIDAVNLCTAVRLKKRGLPYDWMRQAYIPGGTVEQSKLLTDITPDVVESAFAQTQLAEAAKQAGAVLRGEDTLSSLDLACDNALMAYLKTAKYIGLGEQPLVAFAAAKEAELVAIRIIFGGKLAGISDAEIKERLRESYV